MVALVGRLGLLLVALAVLLRGPGTPLSTVFSVVGAKIDAAACDVALRGEVAPGFEHADASTPGVVTTFEADDDDDDDDDDDLVDARGAYDWGVEREALSPSAIVALTAPRLPAMLHSRGVGQARAPPVG